ncbi:hypothetical protein [Jiella pelagia]|uniref:Uncharacterized protein n=1 Tax=Jiella pelagia TaxID=2986949 RepID=A0ABY7BWC9_9HYPH|nr:hypothetical protein [Jiella pelagia]WAP67236.1 hypothetical protein OH818_16805 [Jiella pelagia]
MSGTFSLADLAAFRGRKLRFSLLIRFDFKTETMRVFAGRGRRIWGSTIWTGIDRQITIDGLGEQRGTAVPPVTITLSATGEAALRSAIGESDEAKGRPITISLQLLDDDEQPIGQPIPIFSGTMSQPSISRTEISAEEGPSSTIEITCYGVLLPRAFIPHGRYTPRDQNALTATPDRIFEYVYSLRDATEVWPPSD